MFTRIIYDTGLVTETRIIIASGLAWFGSAIVPFSEGYISERNINIILGLVLFVILFVIIPVMVYFHVAVYKEVRRNEAQIIANQVSVEAKAKMLKNKKAFYTTSIVLLTIILCFIPAYHHQSFKRLVAHRASTICLHSCRSFASREACPQVRFRA